MDIIILPIQRGSDSDSVIEKCDVGVKIYGISPRKLEKKININKEIKTKIVPGNTKPPKTARSSFSINTKIFLRAREYWEFTNQ